MTKKAGYKTATELLSTQNNTEKSTNEDCSTIPNSSTPSQINEQYGKTPIWVRGNYENGFFATMGKYRITPVLEEMSEVYDMLINCDAETVINIFCNMIMAHEEVKKEELNNQATFTDTKETAEKVAEKLK